MPSLREWLTNNYVRGAVSGLGVVNVLAALGELADAFNRRQGRHTLSDEHGTDSVPHH